MFVSVCMKEKEGSLWVVSVINPLDPMISMLIIFLRQDPFLTSRGFKKSWQLQNCCLHFFETNNIRVKIKLLSAAYIYLAAFFCVAQDLLKPPTSIVCLTINHNPFQLESIPLSSRLRCLIQ